MLWVCLDLNYSIAPALPRTLGEKFKKAQNLTRQQKKVEEGGNVMLPMRKTP